MSPVNRLSGRPVSGQLVKEVHNGLVVRVISAGNKYVCVENTDGTNKHQIHILGLAPYTAPATSVAPKVKPIAGARPTIEQLDAEFSCEKDN